MQVDISPDESSLLLTTETNKIFIWNFYENKYIIDKVIVPLPAITGSSAIFTGNDTIIYADRKT